MSKINYVKGDATNPQGKGNKIIAHVCNDMGGWGAGFVLALSAKWIYPEMYYRAQPKYELGTATVINVEDNIFVANMIGQHGIRTNSEGVPPIRYDAIEKALKEVNSIAENMDASIHMPKIGAGLAGGDWNLIEEIIEEVTTVPVTVYLFDEEPKNINL